MGLSLDLRLARHGAAVVALGLLTGFAIGAFHSRNLGNAAHLTGLIGGYGLITLGLLWPRLNLSEKWSRWGAVVTVAAMYLNWLGLVAQDRFESNSKDIEMSSSFLGHLGGAILGLAAILSLISIAVVLAGLRGHRVNDVRPLGEK